MPGVMYTMAIGNPVMAEWIKEEIPTLRWRFHLEEQRQPVAGLTANSILGYLQLTVEGARCRWQEPMAFTRPYCAYALWEHMEAGVRKLAPRVIWPTLHPSVRLSQATNTQKAPPGLGPVASDPHDVRTRQP